jgi:hypothetical protein
MSEYPYAIAHRMVQIIGGACEQHSLDCGECVSSDVFMCETLRQLLALKFRWLKLLRDMREAKP